MRSVRAWFPVCAAVAACIAPVVPAAAKEPPAPAGVEIRFCPAERIASWPLADARQLHGLLLQNVALVNRGASSVTLDSVSIELLAGGAVVDERHLDAAALEKNARRGEALQKSGMLRAVAFQFCGTSLIGAEESLAGPALAQSQGLLVAQQAFAYSGVRDALRVRATFRSGGAAGHVERTLPIDAAPAGPPLVFPLRGAWYVAAGASFHTAHRWAVPEEFALDLLRVGAQGTTHAGDGTRFEDYYAYGAEVLAAAPGRVVAAHDGEPEDARAMRQPGEAADAYFARLLGDQMARLAKGSDAIAGNYVVVRHDERAYTLYAHLKPGSVRVRVGDTVTAGQTLGLLGSSGNSTEPHLHFQLCDRADPLLCAGRPPAFSNVSLPLSDEPRLLQSGDLVIAN